MRGFLVLVLMCAGMWITGCTTTGTAGATTVPASKQPQPYINSVMDPMNQPPTNGAMR